MKVTELTPGAPQHVITCSMGLSFQDGSYTAKSWTTGRTKKQGHQVYVEVITYWKHKGTPSIRPDWVHIGRLKEIPVTEEALRHKPQAQQEEAAA